MTFGGKEDAIKRFAIVYLCTLVVLLPLDFLFLGAIGKKLFADCVGDMTLAIPRVAHGGSPSNWMHSLQYGALFGLFCYATFELTNMALLKHWEWAIVVPDIAWGAVLTAVSAAIGGLLADWILTRVA